MQGCDGGGGTGLRQQADSSGACQAVSREELVWRREIWLAPVSSPAIVIDCTAGRATKVSTQQIDSDSEEEAVTVTSHPTPTPTHPTPTHPTPTAATRTRTVTFDTVPKEKTFARGANESGSGSDTSRLSDASSLDSSHAPTLLSVR